VRSFGQSPEEVGWLHPRPKRLSWQSVTRVNARPPMGPRSRGFGGYVGDTPGDPRRRAPCSPIMFGMLDERDLQIVKALQEDARATYADVARKVGLSPSSVHDRVRKLEATGVIKAYRAEVDPQALGLHVTALVSVTPLDPKQPDDLPDRILGFEEIEDCLSVAGEENYILKVRTRTPIHLEDLLRRLREEAEVRTRTTVVLSIPFEGRPISG